MAYNRYRGSGSPPERMPEAPPPARKPSPLPRQTPEPGKPRQEPRRDPSQPDSGRPPGPGQPRHTGEKPRSAPGNPPPPAGGKPPGGTHPPKQPAPRKAGEDRWGLENILARLDPGRLETEDLLVLAVLWLLYRDSRDKELLIAMGAYLFL